MKKSTEIIINDLFLRYTNLECCREDIVSAIELLIEMYKSKKKLLVCGNGGSASDALHIVGELMKAFVKPRCIEGEEKAMLEDGTCEPEYLIKNLQRALPAISLVSETALITAYSNDNAADLCFAQQVYGYGETGDALIGISTSGNSKNVIYAAQVARAKGVKVISLTGVGGGAIKEQSDVCICVPEKETYKIQELHLPVYHAICLAIENEFFVD
ncbi:MAG: SIS domain-containing protein [Clostridia bacterium]|nr:SIS domain-containing protein [Clostridia bacterium]